MAEAAAIPWPVLRHYDREHLFRIALPLGGIGTGTVSLGGRGDLRDWEIANRPAKGFAPERAFFALYVRREGDEAQTRLLEGPLDLAEYEGGFGSPARSHGLPRFRDCSFEAAYPLGQVLLSDPDMPVAVRLQAFSPLVPPDADRSGIPAAVLRYVLRNTGERPVRASVCASQQNFIGNDGTSQLAKRNRNTVRRADGLVGVLMETDGVPALAETHGTIALAVAAHERVTCRTAWANLSWGDSLLDFWDDFSADGRLDERDAGGVDMPTASLAVEVDLPPGAEQAVTFLLAWHFPNRVTWTPASPEARGASLGDTIGNHYATRYADAWQVAARTASDLGPLEADTVAFVRAVAESDVPEVAREAALANLTALRSQTSFRTPDGRLFGWEGCGDRVGCCHGSCTHVWNYEQATAFLFGDLARSMRETEFLDATRDDGLMSFRVDLPLDRATVFALAAADGQMGCLMKLYRDWQLSGDDAWLARLWPSARRALEFCWVPGGWDGDRDGVMEGCQHNTMDVEYYGPNPQMGGWYLGALRAMEEMARAVGDGAFAEECRRLFTQGSAWLDAHLFNGEYYEHEVRPPQDGEAAAPGLRVGMGAEDLAEPELQLGAGCLVDQLVGQAMAHVCGLGYLLDAANVRAALASIRRYNRRAPLRGHFNHLRSFALGEESALLMASYPRGRRPKRPFPYYNEVMTGFEYTAAVGMLYEGQVEEGLEVIQAIRDRYDGRKRSPFDEAECGHHYARAMASWAALLALTGFHYSGVTQTVRFAAAEGPRRWFWSNGYGWGTCEQQPEADGIRVHLAVGHGSLRLAALALDGVGELRLDAPRTLTAGESLSLTVPAHPTG